jgi:hypothetical protein
VLSNAILPKVGVVLEQMINLKESGPPETLMVTYRAALFMGPVSQIIEAKRKLISFHHINFPLSV